METLEFAPGLQLGIKLIDEQHARFFELMNRLIALDVGSDERQVVAGVIGELASYVTDHFRTEEELMARCDYPEIQAHQLEHARFAGQVEDFHRRFERGDVGLEDEMMAYLVDWFTTHVRREDPKYVPLFKAHGV